MPLASGTRLGPYEVGPPLGAGGMGEVYRARDPRLGRDVAIKVLPASFSDDGDRLRRFEQEARAASALNHPGILTIHDFGLHDGAPYVVSELLEGQNLRDRMAGSALPIRKALDYAIQLARGLAAAHEKGIVHRDLKPENVFVTADGRVKILDFGLAKMTRPAFAGGAAIDGPDPGHGAGHDTRYRRLHVAGTGSRPAGRSPIRHLFVRGDPLRDGDGRTGVSKKLRCRNAERHSQGRAE